MVAEFILFWPCGSQIMARLKDTRVAEELNKFLFPCFRFSTCLRGRTVTPIGSILLCAPVPWCWMRTGFPLSGGCGRDTCGVYCELIAFPLIELLVSFAWLGSAMDGRLQLAPPGSGRWSPNGCAQRMF